MTRVLITGAAGFIGSHLSERLLDEGTEVRGVDRLSSYYDPALKRANLLSLEGSEGFESVEGDLNELDLAALLEGVDVVF
ncbi:MAG: NAD-dependent epimerase/dehydratase family protein, partial [Actinobacteria bacterium]|nr:NAD-dependent epimerase/dehydratase family protein [Actinomycetota bacterium]